MERDGWTFDLAPTLIARMSLPPYVEGVDWFLREAAGIKGVASDSMRLDFCEHFFIGCDASLEYEGPSSGGWVYRVMPEGIRASTDRKVWVCPQMNAYFERPPNKIFISLRRDDEEPCDRRGGIHRFEHGGQAPA